jgi:broad specificity phosphatase PhoE
MKPAHMTHNNADDFNLHDPGLSELGFRQASELGKYLKAHVPAMADAGLIITSPMRRTLQTTEVALDWLIKSGVKVLPDALWQGALSHSPNSLHGGGCGPNH